MSLAVKVAHDLRDAIVDGRLQPYERIKQDAVARRLGVSRLPVRQALEALAAEGLVTLEMDVGARVSPLDPNELIEIFKMREALEPLAVLEATTRLGDEDLQRIRELNDRGERLALAADATGYLAMDREFHSRIFVASGMTRLHGSIRALWQAAERYRRSYSILPHRLEMSVVEHRMIIEALERRAGDDAAQLHEIHIRRTRLTLAEHPELFPAVDLEEDR